MESSSRHGKDLASRVFVFSIRIGSMLVCAGSQLAGQHARVALGPEDGRREDSDPIDAFMYAAGGRIKARGGEWSLAKRSAGSE